MIKGTNSDCVIKDIKITKSKAYITIILSSRVINTPSVPLRIYIKDYELDMFKSTSQLKLLNNIFDTSGTYYKISSETETENTLELVSNTIYWLDKLDSYGDDNFNVSTNMYLEIPIEVDITNKNKASIIKNRFVRQIRIQLFNFNTNSLIWSSEDILLISKEISLPDIKHVHLSTDKNYNVSGQFTYVYTDDNDFSYNNKHLFTYIVVKSPQTHKVLESLLIEGEDYYDSTVKFKLNNTYTDTINISIILKNYYGSEMVIDKYITSSEYTEKLVGGVAMKTLNYTYTPKVKFSDMYIKMNDDIKRVSERYIIPSKTGGTYE